MLQSLEDWSEYFRWPFWSGDEFVDGIECAEICFCKLIKATCVLFNFFLILSHFSIQSLPDKSMCIMIFPVSGFLVKLLNALQKHLATRTFLSFLSKRQGLFCSGLRKTFRRSNEGDACVVRVLGMAVRSSSLWKASLCRRNLRLPDVSIVLSLLWTFFSASPRPILKVDIVPKSALDLPFFDLFYDSISCVLDFLPRAAFRNWGRSFFVKRFSCWLADNVFKIGSIPAALARRLSASSSERVTHIQRWLTHCHSQKRAVSGWREIAEASLRSGLGSNGFEGCGDAAMKGPDERKDLGRLGVVVGGDACLMKTLGRVSGWIEEECSWGQWMRREDVYVRRGCVRGYGLRLRDE